MLRYIRALILALRDILTAADALDSPPIIYLNHMTGTVQIVDTAQPQ